MRFKPVHKLKVSLDLEGSQRELGTLAWSTEDRLAYFEYSPAFVAKPLLVSPFHLYVRPGVIEPKDRTFDGLHGLFNDSLPDGWGRLLLDRRLTQAGIDYRSLTPLDRLSAIGKTGMGALCYVPELPDDGNRDGASYDLDWFVEQVDLVQQEMDIADIDTLQAAQGGSAGARPKIMIGYNPAQHSFVLDYGQKLEPGYEHWIVKGRSQDDHTEIGREELAYALMAKAAGVEMAETRVFSTHKGEHLFATKRFDRTEAGRLHMHTASGILYADHRAPTLDYSGLLTLTHKLTKDVSEVERMFRHMVFNVFARNRDDHTKNHAFLMNAEGRWKVSPAYDLTLSTGPGGQHSTTINGNGRNPGESDILALADAALIKRSQAKTIVDQVRTAVSQWRDMAHQAGLSDTKAAEIDLLLNPNGYSEAMRVHARNDLKITSGRDVGMTFDDNPPSEAPTGPKF